MVPHFESKKTKVAKTYPNKKIAPNSIDCNQNIVVFAQIATHLCE